MDQVFMITGFDINFQDCDVGAVPALSNAYGLDVIWDEQLTNASEIYIEAGDHENLIHMHGDAFCKLMEDLPHNIISTGKDYSRWVSNWTDIRPWWLSSGSSVEFYVLGNIGIALRENHVFHDFLG